VKLKNYIVSIAVLALIISGLVFFFPEENVNMQPTASNPLQQDIYSDPKEKALSNKNAAVAKREVVSPITQFKGLQEITSKRNKELNFYGRVLDQDRNPVPGVTVKVETLSFPFIPRPMLTVVVK